MIIGLLTTSFPRAPEDSAGTFVLGFARALADRGHRIHVLAPEPPTPTRVPSWPGVRVSHVAYLRPRTLQRTFYGHGTPDNLRADVRAWMGMLSFPPALWRATQRMVAGWDAVVSHWAVPSALVAGALADGRPHLAVFHSADVHLLEHLPARRLLAAHIARRATSLQFVSEDLRRRFLSLLPHDDRPSVRERTDVQPMGIEPPAPPAGERRALRTSLGIEGFTILFLGRLVRIKGADVAIRAVAAMRNVSLVVAGDGPERPALERLAQRLGAPVRFVGSVHGEGKHRWLRAVDAFVAPSRVVAGRTEGTPTVVLEAMAASLPIVASCSGGLPDCVRPEQTGLLVPCDDVGALAAALERLRDDPTLGPRLGQAAHRASAAHRWPAIAPRLERALQRPSQ